MMIIRLQPLIEITLFKLKKFFGIIRHLDKISWPEKILLQTTHTLVDSVERWEASITSCNMWNIQTLPFKLKKPMKTQTPFSTLAYWARLSAGRLVTQSRFTSKIMLNSLFPSIPMEFFTGKMRRELFIMIIPRALCKLMNRNKKLIQNLGILHTGDIEYWKEIKKEGLHLIMMLPSQILKETFKEMIMFTMVKSINTFGRYQKLLDLIMLKLEPHQKSGCTTVITMRSETLKQVLWERSWFMSRAL